MRCNVKKIVTYILLAVLIITQVPIQSSADIGGDGNKGGGEHTSGGASGNYTWHEDQSGYRITIVDRNLKPVSKTVDLLFSEPDKNFGSGRKNFYVNARTSLGLSTGTANWDYITFDTLIKKKVIDVKPPHPINRERNSSGKLVAYGRGSEFKGWFLAGEKFITSPYSPPPVFTPTSPSTSNTSRPSSNKKPSSQTNVNTGNQTYRPGNTSGSEMALPNYESMRISPGYRSSTLNTARNKVIQEGNSAHVINLISKAETCYSYRMQTWMRIHNGDVNTAMKKALQETWSYLGSEANSNASRVYAMISIFNRKGTGTGGYAYNNRSTNDGLIYAQSEELLELGEIPLSNKKQEGYGIKILNCKVDGKYLFKLKGVDMSKYSGVVDAIAQLEYDIIVEPIFWFVPTGYNVNTKTAQNYHSNYVYGTISNIIKPELFMAE